MSVRASRAVWSARISPPTSKLVLLALADYLRDETGQLNPSLQSLADKVGVSRSQAQRIVRDLIGAGLVSIAANQFGGKPGSTPHYRLHLERIASLADTGSTDATGTDGMDATPTGSTDATGSADATGSTHATQTTMNHKGTVKEPVVRARGARTCPTSFELSASMMDWAAKEFPGVNVDTETAKFRDHEYPKAKSDWSAAWRNWIRIAGERRTGAPARLPAPRTFNQQDFTEDVAP